jgi:hypothetical protein
MNKVRVAVSVCVGVLMLLLLLWWWWWWWWLCDLSVVMWWCVSIVPGHAGNQAPSFRLSSAVRGTVLQFKHVENLNYAVSLCREVLKLHLPATGGIDIYESKKTLVLGLVWQLMRAQVLAMLHDVGGGDNITDADIVAWANGVVSGAGYTDSIGSFRVRLAVSLCLSVCRIAALSRRLSLPLLLLLKNLSFLCFALGVDVAGCC